MLIALFNLTASLNLKNSRTTDNVDRIFKVRGSVCLRRTVVMLVVNLTVVSILHNVSKNIGFLDGLGVVVTFVFLNLVTILGFAAILSSLVATIANCIGGVVPLDRASNHSSAA